MSLLLAGLGGISIGILLFFFLPTLASLGSIQIQQPVLNTYAKLGMSSGGFTAIADRGGFSFVRVGYDDDFDQWKAKVGKKSKHFDDNANKISRSYGTKFGILHNDISSFLSPRAVEYAEYFGKAIEDGEHVREKPKTRKVQGKGPGKRKGEVVKRDDKGNKIYETEWRFNVDIPTRMQLVDLSKMKMVLRHKTNPRDSNTVGELAKESQAEFKRPAVKDLMIVIIGFAVVFGAVWLASPDSPMGGGGGGGGGVSMPFVMLHDWIVFQVIG